MLWLMWQGQCLLLTSPPEGMHKPGMGALSAMAGSSASLQR